MTTSTGAAGMIGSGPIGVRLALGLNWLGLSESPDYDSPFRAADWPEDKSGGIRLVTSDPLRDWETESRCARFVELDAILGHRKWHGRVTA